MSVKDALTEDEEKDLNTVWLKFRTINKMFDDIERRVVELEKIMHDHFGVDINNCDKEVVRYEGKCKHDWYAVQANKDGTICRYDCRKCAMSKPSPEVKEEKPDYRTVYTQGITPPDTIQIPRALAERFLKDDSEWGDTFWSAVNEMSNAIKTALNGGK